MLTTVKRSIKSALALAIEGFAALASVIGAPVALAFGKLFLAAIFAAIALGIFLRFANRKAVQAPLPSATPWWIFVSSSIASIIEVAALVEATNLPVRFDQVGFVQSNWILVLLALVVAFVFQLKLLKSIVRRTSRARALTPPSSGPPSALVEVER